MSASLIDSVERLQLSSSNDSLDIDDLLLQPGKKEPVPFDDAAAQKQLEKDLLTPSPNFSQEWLGRLQQRWDEEVNVASLFALQPTQTRTITRFVREGLQGRVVGYKEVTIPANRATAKNSTSITRKPAERADFVRGAAGFFPFAPGGLDGVTAVAELEDRAIREGLAPVQDGSGRLNRIIDLDAGHGLLATPPGFSRGLDLSLSSKDRDASTEDQIEKTLAQTSEDLLVDTESASSPVDADTENSVPVDTVSDSDQEDIDSLLPVEYPAFEPHGILAASSARRPGREWAHVVDVKREMTNFEELVPDPAKTWPFTLDTFQKEACYHLENGDSVFVAAHTSAGKTVVAEYAIALAVKHMTKAIYTSPIKALSNQKFRDFRHEFDDVGILTGDVQINAEASCLIMTTEILRSMLYRGADLLRDVEFVIFDEVHYVNDLERGVVWEEVIIMLPDHVSLILLSATVPNTYEFASWVGRTKKKDIYVISTLKRPVPLEHYLWASKEMYKIVGAEKKFLDEGWKQANIAMSGRDKNQPPSQSSRNDGFRDRGQRGSAQSGRGRGDGGNPRGNNSRGRGNPNRGTGNIARTGRGGGRTSAAQDRNVWVHLVQLLRKRDLLPCCIFVFSKKRCEENADALANLDFCTASEKHHIHVVIERSIARLRPEDRVLPQIRRTRELLSRGIGVHHGGMLPIVKELVEILFAKTLVKVLFATETFAMGLNLPTRTVVFSGFRKHDGRSFRDLLPGEYTQMAGRAGRRGIDTVGTVIIVTSNSDEAPPVTSLRQMILGDPTKLRSQFRLTYNMILNLLRVEALKIEEMIKRSFSENATQALLPEQEKQIKLSEADLAKVKRAACETCNADLETCHEAGVAFQSSTNDLHLALVSTPIGKRLFSIKRLIVFQRNGIRTVGIIARDGVSSGQNPTVEVLSLGAKNPSRAASDILPYLPRFRPLFQQLPQEISQMEFKIIKTPLSDVEAVLNHSVKYRGPLWQLKLRKESASFLEKEMKSLLTNWTDERWDEFDWVKAKELQTRDLLDIRSLHARKAQLGHCFECSQFPQHYSMMHDEWLIKEHISQLRQLMSDQNLQLLPDYEQRIEVLKDLGFVDTHSRIELKGKVACEIHSADELVLTELILENALAEFEPAEIVALLSAFVFKEKTDIDPTLPAHLEQGKQTIITISEQVNNRQIQHQVILSSDDANDFVSRPRFGLVEVVYEWAKGMSFNRITDLTDVLEGTIVRVITRLDETCREVKNAARIIGDPDLFVKMQTAQELIKRDITAVASLYM